MGDVVSDLFGGTNKEGMQAQAGDNAERRQFIEQQANQARADIFGIAPAADTNRNMGFQQALDIYGQTMPQQLGTFQQGNVGAQEQLIQGMPQYRNAIMGLPVDYQSFQPQALQYDSGYTQQQLPEFIDTASILGGLQQPGTGGSSSNSGTAAGNAGGLGSGGTQSSPAQQAGLSGGGQSGAGPGYTGGYSPQGGGTAGGWFGSPLGPGDMNRTGGNPGGGGSGQGFWDTVSQNGDWSWLEKLIKMGAGAGATAIGGPLAGIGMKGFGMTDTGKDFWDIWQGDPLNPNRSEFVGPPDPGYQAAGGDQFPGQSGYGQNAITGSGNMGLGDAGGMPGSLGPRSQYGRGNMAGGRNNSIGNMGYASRIHRGPSGDPSDRPVWRLPPSKAG